MPVVARALGEGRDPFAFPSARSSVLSASAFRSSTRTRFRRAVSRSRTACASSPAARRSAAAASSEGRRGDAARYVNVGAYVDAGTMIDSHALVGSCAQIGKRVHISRRRADRRRARADRCVAGGHRGRRGRRRQLRHLRRDVVRAARGDRRGRDPHRSTPVYDIVRGQIYGRAGSAAGDPVGRGRRAGHAPPRGSRQGWTSLDAADREDRDEKTDAHRARRRPALRAGALRAELRLDRAKLTPLPFEMPRVRAPLTLDRERPNHPDLLPRESRGENIAMILRGSLQACARSPGCGALASARELFLAPPLSKKRPSQVIQRLISISSMRSGVIWLPHLGHERGRVACFGADARRPGGRRPRRGGVSRRRSGLGGLGPIRPRARGRSPPCPSGFCRVFWG